MEPFYRFSHVRSGRCRAEILAPECWCVSRYFGFSCFHDPPSSVRFLYNFPEWFPHSTARRHPSTDSYNPSSSLFLKYKGREFRSNMVSPPSADNQISIGGKLLTLTSVCSDRLHNSAHLRIFPANSPLFSFHRFGVPEIVRRMWGSFVICTQNHGPSIPASSL